MSLLTTGNPKTAKGEGYGYLTAIMHLAPYTLSGKNVCPMATEGCAAACLNTAGRGGIGLDEHGLNAIQRARLLRTHNFWNAREAFMATLVKEIAAHVKRARAHGLKPCVRLNGTSDIRWENMPCIRDGIDRANVMDAFPDVQFYDYTKLPNRRNIPANYHLTYSLAEGEKNWEGHLKALQNGMNVAVVLRNPDNPGGRTLDMPDTWNGRPLVNGDASDLRFLDGTADDGLGLYVGLRAKGRAIKDTTGFVHDL